MATQVNVREIILETLLLITRDGEYSHIALKNVLDKYQYLEKRERAFITRVVEGTLERQIEIDYIINQFSKVKVNKQKPVIRTILRSSVYQLKYMDHVPDSAVCNEAVKLAGKKGFVNLKGFVNGVLRNISRNLDMVSYPDSSNEIACLSVRYSLPMWMVEKWISVYGKETVEKMGKAFLKERPVTVRRNTAVVSKEEFEKELEKDGVVYRRHPVLPYAYRIAIVIFHKNAFDTVPVLQLKQKFFCRIHLGDLMGDHFHFTDFIRLIKFFPKCFRQVCHLIEFFCQFFMKPCINLFCTERFFSDALYLIL